MHIAASAYSLITGDSKLSGKFSTCRYVGVVVFLQHIYSDTSANE